MFYLFSGHLRVWGLGFGLGLGLEFFIFDRMPGQKRRLKSMFVKAGNPFGCSRMRRASQLPKLMKKKKKSRWRIRLSRTCHFVTNLCSSCFPTLILSYLFVLSLFFSISSRCARSDCRSPGAFSGCHQVAPPQWPDWVLLLQGKYVVVYTSTRAVVAGTSSVTRPRWHAAMTLIPAHTFLMIPSSHSLLNEGSWLKPSTCSWVAFWTLELFYFFFFFFSSNMAIESEVLEGRSYAHQSTTHSIPAFYKLLQLLLLFFTQSAQSVTYRQRRIKAQEKVSQLEGKILIDICIDTFATALAGREFQSDVWECHPQNTRITIFDQCCHRMI